MRYFSTFSGIGGFEIGIHSAYMQSKAKQLSLDADKCGDNGDLLQGTPSCVGYSEIDKYAIKVYERNFPNVKNFGDITKINADELPDFDCLVGGFPCQAFSIAGKRKGFEDTRGTLFFDLARILRAKRPRLFVFENVKGLLSHDSGRTFKTIIQAIDELGYDCQWQVLNSKNFGVPQNRERVYIVGHLRGTPRPEVFPIGESDGWDSESREVDRRKISSTVTSRFAKGVGNTESRIIDVVVKTDGTTFKKIGEVANEIRQLNNPTHSNDRVYASDGISPTLNTMQGGNRQPFIAAQRGRYNSDGETEQQLEPRFDGVSNTLTAVQKDNIVHDTVRIRRLTPKECERLQGFPDDWTALGVGDEPISDTQRYKMCGNAVTTNVVQAVFERILA